MPNPIKPKRSYTTTNTPTLEAGELGLNATDGKIWIGNAAGNANVLVVSKNTSDLVGTISNAQIANAAVTNLSGTNTGDNTVATAIIGTPSITVATITTTGNIELGHATANTLSAASGILSIEGVVIARATDVHFIGTTSVALNRTSAALTLAGITLTAPNIGTPSAGTLTSCTGLPLTTGVTGILPTANGGTGVAFFTAAGPTIARIYTFPDAAATIARTDAAQTFTGVQTISSQPILSSLTVSSAVATDASKGLVSVTNTGTGNNVLATSPTLVTPNLGTPTTLILTSATGLPLTTGVTGVLPAGNITDSATALFFDVNRSTSQTIATTTFTKFQLNSETTDTAGTYDSSSNYRHTPTTAGVYLYAASVVFGATFADQKAVIIAIYKNGSRVAQTHIYSSGTNDTAATVAMPVKMNGTTDYAEVYIYHEKGSDANTSANAAHNWFKGTRL